MSITRESGTTSGITLSSVSLSSPYWFHRRFSGDKSPKAGGGELESGFSLPFVYLGYARTFGKTIGRYREIEGDAPSTFSSSRNGTIPDVAQTVPLRSAERRIMASMSSG
jgi:hypothetical protein